MGAHADNPASDRYKINLFGPVSVYRPDGRHIAINNSKHAWLIVYLATRPGHVADRQTIAGLLWPSTTDKRAQDSLRTSLRTFRKALGEDAETFFESSNSQLLLRGDQVTIDVDLVQDLVNDETSTAAAHALELVQSEIAEGLVVKEPETAEWLDGARERIRQTVLNLAERKLRDLAVEECEDSLLIRYLSELCIRLEPTFEYAHLRLIEYYAATNQGPLALKQYQRCREILDGQIGAGPSQEIEDLVSKVRSESAHSVSRSATTSNRPILIDEFEKPRVMVRANGVGPNFDDLRTFDKRLSAALSKFRTFDVSASSAVSEDNLVQMHSSPPRFRVDYAITKRGGRQSVDLMLVDKVSNTVLWADTFSFPDLEDDDAHDTLISEISNVVDSEIRRGKLSYRENTRTAYDLWLDADSLAESFHPDADRKAEKILLNLVDCGADFSRIYSSLASIQVKKRLFNPNAVKDKTILDAARRNAHQSIRLDPRDAVNYQTLGWVYYQQRNVKQGKELFEKAHKFNSVSSIVSIACAEAFAYAGETDRAMSLTDRVFRSTSTPPYYFGYLATIFFARGDYESCINMCDLGPPDSLELMVLQAAAYACIGQTERSRSLVLEFLAMASGSSQRSHPFSKTDIGYWLADINMFFEPNTRNMFFDGLRSGGLEVPPDSAAPPAPAMV